MKKHSQYLKHKSYGIVTQKELQVLSVMSAGDEKNKLVQHIIDMQPKRARKIK